MSQIQANCDTVGDQGQRSGRCHAGATPSVKPEAGLPGQGHQRSSGHGATELYFGRGEWTKFDLPPLDDRPWGNDTLDLP